MNIAKVINKLNVYKEFWKLAEKADLLSQSKDYDVDNLILALKHQLNKLDFFYNTLVPKAKNRNPNDTYYKMNKEPKEHQLIYTQIGRGYPKELFDVHWCYVFKHCQTKLLVIPVTSVKNTSSKANSPFEYDILESGSIKCRLHFDEIRCVDKMRIVENKSYINILTNRSDIEEAFKTFINIYEKDIDIKEVI